MGRNGTDLVHLVLRSKAKALKHASSTPRRWWPRCQLLRARRSCSGTVGPETHRMRGSKAEATNKSPSEPPRCAVPGSASRLHQQRPNFANFWAKLGAPRFPRTKSNISPVSQTFFEALSPTQRRRATRAQKEHGLKQQHSAAW